MLDFEIYLKKVVTSGHRLMGTYPKKNIKGVHRNKSGGRRNLRVEAKNYAPPLGAPRGGANLNCKFKTFGFLDIRHKYKIL